MRSIVRTLTAAPDSLLTTVARMKSDLGITVDTYNDQIEGLIEEAASVIEAYVGYRLPLEKIEETFRPDRTWECATALLLDRQPIAEILSITVDGTALPSSEYEVQTKSGAIYRLDTGGTSRLWEWCKAIVVTYWGGYELPDDTDRTLEPAIENACAAMVRSLWYSRRRDPLVKSVEVPDLIQKDYWVGSVGQNSALPQDVERMLAPFKRMRV